MAQRRRNELNKLSEKIIGISIEVHKKLGPGFIERIYEKALIYEFKKGGIRFENQAVIKVKYDNQLLGSQKVDFLIENEVIVELKAVSELNRIHQAQMTSYLKSANKRLGLILNFATGTLGIKRVVNRF